MISSHTHCTLAASVNSHSDTMYVWIQCQAHSLSCFDSGAVKTILRPGDVDKKDIKPTKDTGRNFRAANGGLIPNLGAVELKGKSINNSNMKVVAQVAHVTKPLASAMEMVRADNLVILHKEGGIIKHMSDEQRRRLENYIKNMGGTEIPIDVKENQFTVAMDVDVNTCEQQEAPPPVAGDWEVPKRTISRKWAAKCMGCPGEDECRRTYFEPLRSGF